MPCMKAGNPEIAMLESAPGEKNCLKGLKIPLPGFPYSQLFNFMQFSQKTIVFIYKWKRDLFTCIKKCKTVLYKFAIRIWYGIMSDKKCTFKISQ